MRCGALARLHDLNGDKKNKEKHDYLYKIILALGYVCKLNALDMQGIMIKSVHSPQVMVPDNVVHSMTRD